MEIFDSIVFKILSYQKANWSESEFRKARLLCLFCFFSAFFSVFYILVSYLVGFKAGMVSQGITLVLFIFLIASLHFFRFSNKVNGTLFVLIGFQTIAVLPFFSGGIGKHSIILPWLSVIPVVATLFTSSRQSLVWLIICGITILVYVFIPAHYTPITYDMRYEKVFSTAVYVGLFVIIMVINLSFKRSESKALDSVNRLHSELKSSIRYAKLIQKVVLPGKETRKNVFQDNFCIISPKDVVGGDFTWVKQIGDLKLWAIVDCTGHGVPGAFITFVINNALNEITTLESTDLGKILSMLQVKVETQLNESSSKSREGCDMSICSFDEKTNTLKFVGARRPLVLLNSSKGLVKLKGDKCSIGGLLSEKHKNFQYTVHEMQITERTIVYMYTDGICDQFNEKEDQKFTERRLIKLLKTDVDTDLESLRTEIKSELKKWQGSSPQTDDISFFAVRLSPSFNQLGMFS